MVTAKHELRESLKWALRELTKLPYTATSTRPCLYCDATDDCPNRHIDHLQYCPLALAHARIDDDLWNPKDFERWRDVYYFDIPSEVLLDWLSELGWSNTENYNAPPLVEFVPADEDSYFNVNGGDNGEKTSLAAAIKLAYFKLQDDRKAKRREQYEELKKEFEPEGEAPLEGRNVR
jgi:hypothetical protein